MEPLLLTAAAAAESPLIDLDSTVFLQLFIFLVSAFLLTRVLFRPYLKVRAAREAGIEGAKEQARKMEEEARARMAEYDAAFTKAKVRATEERTKLRLEATERERQIVEDARQKTQTAVDDARKKLDQEAAEARRQLGPQADQIARSIAKKILGREVA
jgi:F-type H+-transporting ATPase subunit b